MITTLSPLSPAKMFKHEPFHIDSSHRVLRRIFLHCLRCSNNQTTIDRNTNFSVRCRPVSFPRSAAHVSGIEPSRSAAQRCLSSPVVTCSVQNFSFLFLFFLFLGAQNLILYGFTISSPSSCVKNQNFEPSRRRRRYPWGSVFLFFLSLVFFPPQEKNSRQAAQKKFSGRTADPEKNPRGCPIRTEGIFNLFIFSSCWVLKI